MIGDRRDQSQIVLREQAGAAADEVAPDASLLVRWNPRIRVDHTELYRRSLAAKNAWEEREGKVVVRQGPPPRPPPGVKRRSFARNRLIATEPPFLAEDAWVGVSLAMTGEPSSDPQ